MRFNSWILHTSVVFVLLFQYGDATLMLTSLLMAAQTGIMMGKLSVGGLLMMLMASQSNTPLGGTARNVRSGLGQSSSRRHKRDLPEIELHGTEEKMVRDRLVRQIDTSFDSLTCIPKFVCGLNAAPPSKKTTLLNDYGHLLKTIFVDDIPKASSELDADDDVLDSEEEEGGAPKTDEEYRLALKEKDKLREMANEEILEEDPGMISYVLKDVMQDMTKLKNPNRQSPGVNTFEAAEAALYGSDSDSEEPEPERPSFSPLKKIASAFKAPFLKIKTSGTSDTTFDKDPFFAGFKRSMRRFRSRPLHDYVPDDKLPTREERAAYLKQKEIELEQVTDAVQKYEIAEDIGKRLRSKDDCAAAFKKCPYEWEQVMTMVNNLRQNVMPGRPGLLGSSSSPVVATAEKVVFLKTSDGKIGTGTPIGLNNADNGVTTVTHDLGNGNTVEISMKLFKIQKNPNNKTMPDDDEFDSDHPMNIGPTLGSITPSALPTLNGSLVLDVKELADDEFQAATDLDSAVAIFQAINSGSLKPSKKKIASPFVVVEDDSASGSKESKEKTKAKPNAKTTSRPAVIPKSDKSNNRRKNGNTPKVEVSDDDQSITVTLNKAKVDKQKPKPTEKAKEEDTSEEDDDTPYEDLLGFRGMVLEKTRPSSAAVIGTKFQKDKSPATTPSSLPVLPPSLTRRRYPGTTRINSPQRYNHKSMDLTNFEKPELIVL